LLLLKISKNLHVPFAAMPHVAGGLRLNALITVIEENFICLVGTQIPTVSMMEWQLILGLKSLIRNKAS
jgi:hypothetical protein